MRVSKLILVFLLSIFKLYRSVQLISTTNNIELSLTKCIKSNALTMKVRGEIVQSQNKHEKYTISPCPFNQQH